MSEHEHGSGDENNLSGFYRTAFWWMMGLGATGIAGSITMAVQLNVAVGKLDVQMQGLADSYLRLSESVERASGDRYTSTTASVDKATNVARFESVERRLDKNTEAIVELRLWRASQEKPKP